MALRACTMTVVQPASAIAATKSRRNGQSSWSSMPMRHFTVTGTETAAAHRAQAIRDQPRPRHQAGAERRLLHAIAGAADVQVDLVVAECGADRGRLGERPGFGAAELQRDRMLRGIELEEVIAVALHDRQRDDHLGVEQDARRELAQEVPAVPVGPVHHRRDGEPAINAHSTTEGSPKFGRSPT